MKRIKFLPALVLAMIVSFTACQQESDLVIQDEISQDVLDKLQSVGFDITNQAPIKFEQGYLVEGDIYIAESELSRLTEGKTLPNIEQYHTTNLVSTGGSRVITMYAEEGGRKGYSSGMIAGLDEAIRRYNAEGLEITFQRIGNQNQADIVMTRLRKGDERRGILGSAGFPTSSGDPYGEIKMSGILESSYGLSVDGIATIIAHEMGHCIGFRHTDFFDRSISCGGSTSNEGQSTVGAIHIPNTPTGATLAAQSFMLACTDGSDRPFNGDDVTALNYLY